MKRTELLAIASLVLGLLICPAHADLQLPYKGEVRTPGRAFEIRNTFTGTSAAKLYGGYFRADGPEARGLFGFATGNGGIAVKGWASDDGNSTNYGGHFCTTGRQGIGVYGWAENTENVVNYGGKFLAQGLRGVGVHPMPLQDGSRIRFH